MVRRRATSTCWRLAAVWRLPGQGPLRLLAVLVRPEIRLIVGDDDPPRQGHRIQPRPVLCRESDVHGAQTVFELYPRRGPMIGLVMPGCCATQASAT